MIIDIIISYMASLSHCILKFLGALHMWSHKPSGDGRKQPLVSQGSNSAVLSDQHDHCCGGVLTRGAECSLHHEMGRRPGFSLGDGCSGPRPNRRLCQQPIWPEGILLYPEVVFLLHNLLHISSIFVSGFPLGPPLITETWLAWLWDRRDRAGSLATTQYDPRVTNNSTLVNLTIPNLME